MRNAQPQRFLLALLLSLCASIAVASPIDLASVVQILEDPDGNLTIGDVRGNAARLFRPWEGRGDVNRSYSGAAVWLRLPLARDGGSPQRLLELAFLLDDVRFFAPGQPPVVTGHAQPFDTRPWPHRFLVFPVTLEETPQYHYLRVRTGDSMTLPLNLWEPAEFAAHQQQTYLLLALYLGGLLALLLYNLLIYLSLRESVFVHYVFFVASMGLAQLVGNGIFQQFLWPSSWPWFEPLGMALFALTGAYTVLFTQSFLQTGRHLPRLHWVLRGFGAAFLVITVLALAGFRIGEAISISGLLVAGAIVASGIQALRDGNRSARFFLIAWGVLFIGIIVAALRNLGLVPSNAVTGYAILIASAIEMLLLSLALADRIRVERQAREQAQAEMLSARQTLVETLRQSEARLEQTVAARTEQLAHSLRKEQELLARYVRFGAMIAHEFRNPLAIIKSQLALLHEERVRGIDFVARRIDAATSASQRLERLFDKWLRGDQLGERMERITPAPIALSHWLPEVVEESRRCYPTRTIEWQLPTVLPDIVGDADLLRSALQNLIENAAKYTPADTPISIEAFIHTGHVELAVCDMGPGIAPEDREAIFLEYVRGSNATAATGLGLGLALVSRVMALHGGRIELDSTPGEGCRFCLWLPTYAEGSQNHG